MNYTQRTAIMAMIASVESQLGTIKLLLNLDSAEAPAAGKAVHSTRRVMENMSGAMDYTSEEDDEKIAAMLRRDQDELERAVGQGERHGAEQRSRVSAVPAEG